MERVTTFKEALREDLRQSPVAPDVVAEELEMSYSMLMNAVNPDFPKFNFQARKLAHFAQITGGRRTLGWLADSVSCVLIDLPKVPGEFGRIDELVAESVKEFGDVLMEIGKALMDRRVTEAEARVLEREIDELVMKAVALKEEVAFAARAGEV